MTKDTTPFHIWSHEVELAAIHAGADAEAVRAVRGKLRAWYNAGEPIWMAADGLKQLARGYVLATREDSDARVIRQAILHAKKN